MVRISAQRSTCRSKPLSSRWQFPGGCCFVHVQRPANPAIMAGLYRGLQNNDALPGSRLLRKCILSVLSSSSAFRDRPRKGPLANRSRSSEEGVRRTKRTIGSIFCCGAGHPVRETAQRPRRPLAQQLAKRPPGFRANHNNCTFSLSSFSSFLSSPSTAQRRGVRTLHSIPLSPLLRRRLVAPFPKPPPPDLCHTTGS